jgi:hypothetical protein
MSRSRRALILLGVWLVSGLAALPQSLAAQSPGTLAPRPVPKHELRVPGTPSANLVSKQEQRAPDALAARPAPPQKLRAPGTPPASPVPKQENRSEPLRPAPQTIRERWGIRVFLAWLWFTTGVLLYLLRRLVRESDRVHGLGYATPEPTPPKKSEPGF